MSSTLKIPQFPPQFLNDDIYKAGGNWGSVLTLYHSEGWLLESHSLWSENLCMTMRDWQLAILAYQDIYTQVHWSDLQSILDGHQSNIIHPNKPNVTCCCFVGCGISPLFSFKNFFSDVIFTEMKILQMLKLPRN